MPEETGDVTQAIGLIPVDCRVIIRERLLESICPDTVEFAEALANEAVEGRVGTLLGATFDNHVDEFNLKEWVSVCTTFIAPTHTSSPSWIWTLRSL
jgi:hypothetical protein